jgi:hypothetical protein
MTLSPQRLDKAAEAVYRKFEDRPLYAQAQMNGIIADELARAAISAYLGDTHVDVPREPTADMCEHGSAIDETSEGRTPAITTSQADECYRAMISAELTERDA